jgi:hypothetical protein
MIQGLVEVPSQQTDILGFIELACADYGSSNGMGGNEVADCGPDEAVVGGDPAVMAIQKLIDRLPGVVDAAGKVISEAITKSGEMLWSSASRKRVEGAPHREFHRQTVSTT